jgi:release factor glutamine methyltransferase
MPNAVLHDVLAAAVRELRDAGVPAADAAADVDVLARHVLGWDRARLVAHRLDAVPGTFAAPFWALIARRTARVPVAYLTGVREFYGLDFEITPDVLVPRPETELAVEATLAAIDGVAAGARIVDVGTGSACIAVAVATGRPGTTILAIDRARAALAVAARNVRRHHVADRIALVAGDLLTALAPAGAFDVVVSNPPYVPDASVDVAVDVARHEPAGALYAGPDGLDAVRRLVADAPTRLRPGGQLIMEIGAGQADAVAALAAADGRWAQAAFRSDLQGIARVAVLSRHAPASR